MTSLESVATSLESEETCLESIAISLEPVATSLESIAISLESVVTFLDRIPNPAAPPSPDAQFSGRSAQLVGQEEQKRSARWTLALHKPGVCPPELVERVTMAGLALSYDSQRNFRMAEGFLK